MTYVASPNSYLMFIKTGGTKENKTITSRYIVVTVQTGMNSYQELLGFDSVTVSSVKRSSRSSSLKLQVFIL